jgi:hypothetical protein
MLRSKKLKWFGMSLSAAMMAAGFSSCDSSSGSSNGTPSQQAQAQAQNVSAQCSNPYPLNAPGLTLASPGQVWDNHRYNLVELDLYALSPTGDSFSATESDGNVTMTCQGVSQQSNLNANFNVANWIDGSSQSHSDEDSSLEVSFSQGQLTEAQLNTTPDSDTGSPMLGNDTTSADNIPIPGSNGMTDHVSYRIYKNQDGSVELRTMMELTADNGQQFTEYARAIFK